MSKAIWHKQPEASAAALTSIGQDVERLNAVSAMFAHLRHAADRGSERASALQHMIATSRANIGYADPDIRQIEELSDDQANQLLREGRHHGLAKVLLLGAAGHGIAHALDDIEYGTNIQTSRHWRYRLEPLESGVVMYERRTTLMPPSVRPDPNHSSTRLLEVGEVLEGKLESIRPLPALGGVLGGFEPMLRGVSVAGLVSPETGEAQVALELFAKQPRASI